MVIKNNEQKNRKSQQTLSDFWDARENARKYMISIFAVMMMMIRSLDTENRDQVGVAKLLLIVSSIYIIATLFGFKISRRIFDWVIGFISVICCTFFMYLSSIRHLDFSHLAIAHTVLIKQMNRGRIPIPLILFNTMPIIATSVGMSVNVVKYVIVYNLIAFMIISYNVSSHTTCFFEEFCNVDYEEKYFSFIIDFIINLVIITMAWFCCIPAAEIGNQFIRSIDADSQADAMLSNILKNSIAGASCLIEIEQEEMKANPCEKCGIRHRLTQARHQLLHSMRWCMSRQVMVELASGTYKTYLSDFNLNNFFIDMNVMSENNKIIFEDITGISDRYLLKLDENMVHVAIENGLFSASSHGTGNIKLETFIIDNDKKNSQKCLQFKISNSIPESVLENITSEKGKEFNKKLQKHAERARQHGSRPTNTLTLATVNSSAGLHRISVAVTGAGGSFDIRYDEITSKVILTINIPVELSPVPLVSFVSESESDFKPSENSDKVENNNVVVDGNEALNKGSSKNEVQKTSKILSINTKNLSSSSSSSLSSSKPKKAVHNNGDESPKTPKLTFPANLTICAIDDSKIICKGYERLLLPLLKCDSKSSLVTCPKSKEDIRQFLEVVLPWYNNNNSSRSDHSNTPQNQLNNHSSSTILSNLDKDMLTNHHLLPGVVIFDQNIDLKEPEGIVTVLGTDLAVELKRFNFNGLVVIRSANSSSSDFDQYMSTGVVDFCVGKSESHKDLASRIQNAYISKNMISH